MEIWNVEFSDNYSEGYSFEMHSFSTESLAKAFGPMRLAQLVEDGDRYNPTFQIWKSTVHDDLSILKKCEDQVKQQEIEKMFDERN